MELYRIWLEAMEKFDTYVGFRWLKENRENHMGYMDKMCITVGRVPKEGGGEIFEYVKAKNVNELIDILSGVGILIGVLTQIRGESLETVLNKAQRTLTDSIAIGVSRYEKDKGEN